MQRGSPGLESKADYTRPRTASAKSAWCSIRWTSNKDLTAITQLACDVDSDATFGSSCGGLVADLMGDFRLRAAGAAAMLQL